MSSDLIIPWICRWLHINAAALLIGAPFFERFALTPIARKVLSPESHEKLRDTINARWRHVAYMLMTIIFVSGFYQFFVPTRVNGVLITSRWRDFSEADKKIYHMIFGFKMMAAFGFFFMASVLPGRMKTFAPLRAKYNLSMTILLIFAGIVLACATGLTLLPKNAGTVIPSNVANTLP